MPTNTLSFFFLLPQIPIPSNKCLQPEAIFDYEEISKKNKHTQFCKKLVLPGDYFPNLMVCQIPIENFIRPVHLFVPYEYEREENSWRNKDDRT